MKTPAILVSAVMVCASFSVYAEEPSKADIVAFITKYSYLDLSCNDSGSCTIELKTAETDNETREVTTNRYVINLKELAYPVLYNIGGYVESKVTLQCFNGNKCIWDWYKKEKYRGSKGTELYMLTEVNTLFARSEVWDTQNVAVTPQRLAKALNYLIAQCGGRERALQKKEPF